MAKKNSRAVKPPAEADTIALYTHLLLGAQSEVKAKQRRLTVVSKEAGQNNVNWSDVKAALKEYEQPAEVRAARAKRQQEIYAGIGVPVQIEMFDAYLPKVNDSEADAERKGRFAAVCHGECTPPYPPGSREGQAWIKGWGDFMALVDQYNNRFRDEGSDDAAGAASTEDDWDDKPVASVQQLEAAEQA